MGAPSISELVEQWQLEVEGEPQQSFSGVIYLVRRGNDNLVLKVPRRGLPTGWAALRHFAGSGAVQALDHRPEGAILLERAIPGQTLLGWAHEGGDDEAMHVLCSVAAALHSRPCPAEGFELVEDRRAYYDSATAANSMAVSPASLERARGLFAELAASQRERRLCHGDLHHENIVHDKKRGWLAIDPHGVIAEPAFEIGAALRNSNGIGRLTSSIVDRRVAIASERLELDRQRICAWAFCSSIALAIWAEKAVKQEFDPQEFLSAAEAIQPFLP